MKKYKNQTIDQQRATYERLLIKFSAKLVAADTDYKRKVIQADIDKLKDNYLDRRSQHDATDYCGESPNDIDFTAAQIERGATPGKRPANDDRWVDIYADDEPPSREELQAARDMRDVLGESSRNPYKTNDRKDDMRYQTHGTRNPRSKKRF